MKNYYRIMLGRKSMYAEEAYKRNSLSGSVNKPKTPWLSTPHYKPWVEEVRSSTGHVV